MPIAFVQLDWLLKTLLYWPAEILVLLTAMALLAGVRVKPAVAWLVGVLAMTAIVVRTFDRYPEGFDLRIFWDAGAVVLRGEDPYLADGRILNPPQALPLMALLGIVSFAACLLVWTILNVAACCGLGLLAQKALAAQGPDYDWELTPSALAVLSGALAFCYACRRGLDAGQLSLLAIVPLFVALWAQGRARPILAGAMLAVASIKAATWLPFMLLFLGKKDWKSWVAMAVVSIALALSTTLPDELVNRCRECLDNIATLSQPGRVNDYVSSNSQSVDLIMLDRALYCAGVGDRAVIKGVSLAITGMLGLWLLVGIVRGHWSRAAACSLVAFFAALFLYHRQYDMVLLAVPLVYVTGRAQHERSAARWLYGVSGVAILAVLYFRLAELEVLQLKLDSNPSPIVAAVVMPYCIWCVLVGLICLALAERFSPRVKKA
ncbi:MAG TPA: glycosyltransferase family 87 protein [Gemmataceae bacterium]|nr:glycosyltransferase family 87 protein [Gemmataceae bacterium]